LRHATICGTHYERQKDVGDEGLKESEDGDRERDIHRRMEIEYSQDTQETMPKERKDGGHQGEQGRHCCYHKGKRNHLSLHRVWTAILPYSIAKKDHITYFMILLVIMSAGEKVVELFLLPVIESVRVGNWASKEVPFWLLRHNIIGEPNIQPFVDRPGHWIFVPTPCLV
jgi:hypothetical protein